MKDNRKNIPKYKPLPQIILASQSPRRKEILEVHGHKPVIVPAYVDEIVSPGMSPKDATIYLALKKGRFVLGNYPDIFSGGEVIIASDTIVYKDTVLGKPADESEARKMIKKLRGTSHEVITGVALIEAGTGRECCFHETTKVFCRNMSDDEVEEYISTKEPYDKAGGYGIQGIFGKYIDHIEGDYENVVGLPYQRLKIELVRFLEESIL